MNSLCFVTRFRLRTEESDHKKLCSEEDEEESRNKEDKPQIKYESIEDLTNVDFEILRDALSETLINFTTFEVEKILKMIEVCGITREVS